MVVNFPTRTKNIYIYPPSHCNHLWKKASTGYCGKGGDIQLLKDNYGLLQLFIFIVLVVPFHRGQTRIPKELERRVNVNKKQNAFSHKLCLLTTVLRSVLHSCVSQSGEPRSICTCEPLRLLPRSLSYPVMILSPVTRTCCPEECPKQVFLCYLSIFFFRISIHLQQSV